MRAIILAAGEGKRLRPYTNDRPKCMVEIEGVSLIDRQIKILKSKGVEEIIIIGGYKSDMLEGKGNKLVTNPRYHETNMVWSLFCAEEFLVGDVIISYGDIVYSSKIISALVNSNYDISVTIDMNWESYWRDRNEDPLEDAETLKLRTDGTIKEIGQKPNSINDIEGQYMGLMKFTNRGISNLRSTFHKCKKNKSVMGNYPENAYMTDLLMQIIYNGIKVHSIPTNSAWVEVDTTNDLESEYTLKRISEI